MNVLAAYALPLHTAGPYVAAAYIVFVVMLVVYLGIMSLRTSRTKRELAELRREMAERQASEERDHPAGQPAGSERRAEPERSVAL